MSRLAPGMMASCRKVGLRSSATEGFLVGNSLRHPHRYASPVPQFSHLAIAMPEVTMITLVIEGHNLTRPSRSALVTTETELKLIAALAIIGLNSNPRKG